MSFDKQITRAARAGHPSVLLYGRRWGLEPDGIYKVQYNRKQPGLSRVVRVRARPGA